MALKIAVLDDYQNVARDMADWSGLEADHDITFFHDIYEGLDGFARRLEPFDILCIMRERSPIGRDLIERLPNAKLFVTAGMRNAAIDLDACKERGIPYLYVASQEYLGEAAGLPLHRETSAVAVLSVDKSLEDELKKIADQATELGDS